VTTSEPILLDLKAAVPIAGVSKDLLIAAIKKGTLVAVRSGVNEDGDPVGKYLVTRDWLVAWSKTLESA
jgi:hypothetical protein